MFGDEALNAMVMVEQILGDLRVSGQQKSLENEFKQFLGALENLKSNPVVMDLCSIGFEVLAGLVLRSEGWEGIVLGQDVPFREERKRDVDVFGKKGDDLIMVECKAYHEHKELSPSEVTKFFVETVPSCRKWWTKKENKAIGRCYAEIWTSGAIGEDAKAKLKELALKDNIQADILGPDEILARIPSDMRKRSNALLSVIAKGGQEWGDLEVNQ